MAELRRPQRHHSANPSVGNRRLLGRLSATTQRGSFNSNLNLQVRLSCIPKPCYHKSRTILYRTIEEPKLLICTRPGSPETKFPAFPDVPKNYFPAQDYTSLTYVNMESSSVHNFPELDLGPFPS
ncbi:hypothetical protein M0R45_027215 [Rubus argutus]|uniref:Uncharacterized protein n=1 Tax=Rubus argutus TaxID=59490 RepID=A0AAW1X3G5_RUBAR